MLKNKNEQDHSNAESLPEQKCSLEQRVRENESSLEHETAKSQNSCIYWRLHDHKS